MRTREDTNRVYTFGYLDESSTSGNRYFGCGLLLHGPCVSGADDGVLNKSYREWQVKHGFRRRADIAWKKTPSKEGKYLSFYIRLVRSFFSHPKLCFNALVVDTYKYPLDSASFFGGSKNRGIDAFAYHLARARALRFPRGSTVFRF